MRCLSLCALLAAMLAVGGCTVDQERLDQVRHQLGLVQGDVAEFRGLHSQFEGVVDAMPDDELSDELRVRLEKVDRMLAAAEAKLPELQAALDDADGDVLEAVEGAVPVLAGALPPPWNAVAPPLAIAVLALIRSAYNRASARRLARSIDPYLQPSTDEARRISAAQGAGVKRIVDEAQGKRLAIPL